MELAGKRALVTGGGHRIGAGLGLGLATAGCDLVLHYNRSQVEAKQTAAAAQRLGVEVELLSADLSQPDAAAGLIQAATQAGPLQILINSAASFPIDHLRDVSQDRLRQTLDLVLGAAVLTTQAFASALPSELEGAVVNVTDWKTARPYPNHFSYTLAKGALDTFTRVAAAELAPRIRVNAIALGVILPPAGAPDGYAERLAQTLPLSRVGGVAAAAEGMLALLRNDFITGEILRVNGGGHLR